MGDVSKGDRVREWLKVFVPLVTAFIVVGIGGWISIFVANEIQRRAQERSNDIEIAKVVVEVMVQGDTNNYYWLGDLIRTIQDSTLREVMRKGVQSSPSIPVSIKKDVEIKVEEAISIQDKMTVVVTSGLIAPPRRRSIQVICMREDSLSLDWAQRIGGFFSEKGFSNKVVVVGRDWYYDDRGRTESMIAEIKYNSSDEEFARQIKTMLDSVPGLGSFRLKKTNVGTSAYSISIVLPDKTK